VVLAERRDDQVDAAVPVRQLGHVADLGDHLLARLDRRLGGLDHPG
jgi:hypothetical protein